MPKLLMKIAFSPKRTYFGRPDLFTILYDLIVQRYFWLVDSFILKKEAVVFRKNWFVSYLGRRLHHDIAQFAFQISNDL